MYPTATIAVEMAMTLIENRSPISSLNKKIRPNVIEAWNVVAM